MSTVPVAAGLTAVILLAVLNTTLVAGTPPNETVAPFTNPLPWIFTVVPPATGPADGDTDVTVGNTR
jgi:hypothetical protein